MTPQFLIGIHLGGNNTFCRFKHSKKWNVHLRRWLAKEEVQGKRLKSEAKQITQG